MQYPTRHRVQALTRNPASVQTLYESLARPESSNLQPSPSHAASVSLDTRDPTGQYLVP